MQYRTKCDQGNAQQNLDQIAELKKRVCFHTFESENNPVSCLQLCMYKVKETNNSNANNLNDNQFIDEENGNFHYFM